MRWYVSTSYERLCTSPFPHMHHCTWYTPQMLNHMAEMDLYDLYVANHSSSVSFAAGSHRIAHPPPPPLPSLRPYLRQERIVTATDSTGPIRFDAMKNLARKWNLQREPGFWRTHDTRVKLAVALAAAAKKRGAYPYRTSYAQLPASPRGSRTSYDLSRTGGPRLQTAARDLHSPLSPRRPGTAGTAFLPSLTGSPGRVYEPPHGARFTNTLEGQDTAVIEGKAPDPSRLAGTELVFRSRVDEARPFQSASPDRAATAPSFARRGLMDFRDSASSMPLDGSEPAFSPVPPGMGAPSRSPAMNRGRPTTAVEERLSMQNLVTGLEEGDRTVPRASSADAEDAQRVSLRQQCALALRDMSMRKPHARRQIVAEGALRGLLRVLNESAHGSVTRADCLQALASLVAIPPADLRQTYLQAPMAMTHAGVKASKFGGASQGSEPEPGADTVGGEELTADEAAQIVDVTTALTELALLHAKRADLEGRPLILNALFNITAHRSWRNVAVAVHSLVPALLALMKPLASTVMERAVPSHDIRAVTSVVLDSKDCAPRPEAAALAIATQDSWCIALGVKALANVSGCPDGTAVLLQHGACAQLAAMWGHFTFSQRCVIASHVVYNLARSKAGCKRIVDDGAVLLLRDVLVECAEVVQTVAGGGTSDIATTPQPDDGMDAQAKALSSCFADFTLRRCVAALSQLARVPPAVPFIARCNAGAVLARTVLARLSEQLDMSGLLSRSHLNLPSTSAGTPAASSRDSPGSEPAKDSDTQMMLDAEVWLMHESVAAGVVTEPKYKLPPTPGQDDQAPLRFPLAAHLTATYTVRRAVHALTALTWTQEAGIVAAQEGVCLALVCAALSADGPTRKAALAALGNLLATADGAPRAIAAGVVPVLLALGQRHDLPELDLVMQALLNASAAPSGVMALHALTETDVERSHAALTRPGVNLHGLAMACALPRNYARAATGEPGATTKQAIDDLDVDHMVPIQQWMTAVAGIDGQAPDAQDSAPKCAGVSVVVNCAMACFDVLKSSVQGRAAHTKEVALASTRATTAAVADADDQGTESKQQDSARSLPGLAVATGAGDPGWAFDASGQRLGQQPGERLDAAAAAGILSARRITLTDGTEAPAQLSRTHLALSLSMACLRNLTTPLAEEFSDPGASAPGPDGMSAVSSATSVGADDVVRAAQSRRRSAAAHPAEDEETTARRTAAVVAALLESSNLLVLLRSVLQAGPDVYKPALQPRGPLSASSAPAPAAHVLDVAPPTNDFGVVEWSNVELDGVMLARRPCAVVTVPVLASAVAVTSSVAAGSANAKDFMVRAGLLSFLVPLATRAVNNPLAVTLAEDAQATNANFEVRWDAARVLALHALRAVASAAHDAVGAPVLGDLDIQGSAQAEAMAQRASTVPGTASGDAATALSPYLADATPAASASTATPGRRASTAQRTAPAASPDAGELSRTAAIQQRLLLRSATDCRRFCAVGLAALACDARENLDLVDAGVLDALVALCIFSSDGDPVRARVAAALRSLSADAEVAERMCQLPKAVPTVVDLASSNSAEVRRQAVGIAMHLSRINGHEVDLIVEGMVPALLVIALIRNNTDGRTQALCVETLHNLMALPSMRLAVLSQGVIWALQKLALSPAVATQRACAMTLFRLSEDPDAQERLVREGGLRSVISVLKAQENSGGGGIAGHSFVELTVAAAATGRTMGDDHQGASRMARLLDTMQSMDAAARTGLTVGPDWQPEAPQFITASDGRSNVLASELRVPALLRASAQARTASTMGQSGPGGVVAGTTRFGELDSSSSWALGTAGSAHGAPGRSAAGTKRGSPRVSTSSSGGLLSGTGAAAPTDPVVGAFFAAVLAAVSTEQGSELHLVKEGAVEALVLLADRAIERIGVQESARAAGGKSPSSPLLVAEQASAAPAVELGNAAAMQDQRSLLLSCAAGLFNISCAADPEVKHRLVADGAARVFVRLAQAPGQPLSVRRQCAAGLLNLLWGAPAHDGVAAAASRGGAGTRPRSATGSSAISPVRGDRTPEGMQTMHKVLQEGAVLALASLATDGAAEDAMTASATLHYVSAFPTTATFLVSAHAERAAAAVVLQQLQAVRQDTLEAGGESAERARRALAAAVSASSTLANLVADHDARRWMLSKIGSGQPGLLSKTMEALLLAVQSMAWMAARATAAGWQPAFQVRASSDDGRKAGCAVARTPGLVSAMISSAESATAGGQGGIFAPDQPLEAATLQAQEVPAAVADWEALAVVVDNLCAFAAGVALPSLPAAVAEQSFGSLRSARSGEQSGKRGTRGNDIMKMVPPESLERGREASAEAAPLLLRTQFLPAAAATLAAAAKGLLLSATAGRMLLALRGLLLDEHGHQAVAELEFAAATSQAPSLGAGLVALMARLLAQLGGEMDTDDDDEGGDVDAVGGLGVGGAAGAAPSSTPRPRAARPSNFGSVAGLGLSNAVRDAWYACTLRAGWIASETLTHAVRVLCSLAQQDTSRVAVLLCGGTNALISVSKMPRVSHVLRHACLRGLCELAISRDENMQEGGGRDITAQALAASAARSDELQHQLSTAIKAQVKDLVHSHRSNASLHSSSTAAPAGAEGSAAAATGVSNSSTALEDKDEDGVVSLGAVGALVAVMGGNEHMKVAGDVVQDVNAWDAAELLLCKYACLDLSALDEKACPGGKAATKGTKRLDGTGSAALHRAEAGCDPARVLQDRLTGVMPAPAGWLDVYYEAAGDAPVPSLYDLLLPTLECGFMQPPPAACQLLALCTRVAWLPQPATITVAQTPLASSLPLMGAEHFSVWPLPLEQADLAAHLSSCARAERIASLTGRAFRSSGNEASGLASETGSVAAGGDDGAASVFAHSVAPGDGSAPLGSDVATAGYSVSDITRMLSAPPILVARAAQTQDAWGGAKPQSRSSEPEAPAAAPPRTVDASPSKTSLRSATGSDSRRKLQPRSRRGSQMNAVFSFGRHGKAEDWDVSSFPPTHGAEWPKIQAQDSVVIAMYGSTGLERWYSADKLDPVAGLQQQQQQGLNDSAGFSQQVSVFGTVPPMMAYRGHRHKGARTLVSAVSAVLLRAAVEDSAAQQQAALDSAARASDAVPSMAALASDPDAVLRAARVTLALAMLPSGGGSSKAAGGSTNVMALLSDAGAAAGGAGGNGTIGTLLSRAAVFAEAQAAEVEGEAGAADVRTGWGARTSTRPRRLPAPHEVPDGVGLDDMDYYYERLPDALADEDSLSRDGWGRHHLALAQGGNMSTGMPSAGLSIAAMQLGTGGTIEANTGLERRLLANARIGSARRAVRLGGLSPAPRSPVHAGATAGGGNSRPDSASSSTRSNSPTMAQVAGSLPSTHAKSSPDAFTHPGCAALASLPSQSPYPLPVVGTQYEVRPTSEPGSPMAQFHSLITDGPPHTWRGHCKWELAFSRPVEPSSCKRTALAGIITARMLVNAGNMPSRMPRSLSALLEEDYPEASFGSAGQYGDLVRTGSLHSIQSTRPGPEKALSVLASQVLAAPERIRAVLCGLTGTDGSFEEALLSFHTRHAPQAWGSTHFETAMSTAAAVSEFVVPPILLTPPLPAVPASRSVKAASAAPIALVGALASTLPGAGVPSASTQYLGAAEQSLACLMVAAVQAPPQLRLRDYERLHLQLSPSATLLLVDKSEPALRKAGAGNDSDSTASTEYEDAPAEHASEWMDDQQVMAQPGMQAAMQAGYQQYESAHRTHWAEQPAEQEQQQAARPRSSTSGTGRRPASCSSAANASFKRPAKARVPAAASPTVSAALRAYNSSAARQRMA